MGRATNWSRVVFISEEPDFWTMKDDNRDPAQPPPQYDAPSTDTCNRIVIITYIGQILNTFNNGFIYLDGDPPGITIRWPPVNYMTVRFISEEDWRKCKYKWITAEFSGAV